MSVVELYVSRATDFFGIAKVCARALRCTACTRIARAPLCARIATVCAALCARIITPRLPLPPVLSACLPCPSACLPHLSVCLTACLCLLPFPHTHTHQVREIYENAIESAPPAELPEADVRVLCVRYAQLERKLGEIDRARAIFVHGSHLANPQTAK